MKNGNWRIQKIKRGFIPIGLMDYVELHLRSNPGTDRDDLIFRLKDMLEDSRRGVRCNCGEPIWIIGSAEVGHGCFACITGDPVPDDDYEIIDDGPSP